MIMKKIKGVNKRLIAIVTLFHPRDVHVDNIEKIADQVDELLLCDNSPYDNENMFKKYRNITYFFWNKNKGLSQAFNSVLLDGGVGWRKDDYVIFFDQDTDIPKGHIHDLVNEYEKLKAKNFNIGCIGPIYYNTSGNRMEIPKIKKKISERSLSVESIITTSMLCKYGDLENIGFWNEKIFLDLADWDICFRFIQHNFLCCMSFASIVRHSVGEDEKRIGRIRIRVWNPIREYYQLRDGRYLFHEKYAPLKYKIYYILRIMFISPLHIFFLGDKRARIYYMKKGLKDYRLGIVGVGID